MASFIRIMNIQRGKRGLGFILSNQNPCIVSSINQNGPADLAGLKTGDEILEVNKVDVSHLRHDEVVKRILKYSSQTVELKVKTFSLNQDFDQHTGTPRKHLFGSVVKEFRTSMLFNSPVITKKSELQNLSDNKEKDGYNSSDNTSNSSNQRTILKPININHLSNRRDISDVYDDSETSIGFQSEDEPSSLITPTIKNCRPYSMMFSNEYRNGTSPNILANIFGVEDLSIHCNEITLPANNVSNDLCPVYSVVVYYQCTVELPNVTNLPVSSLNAIDNSVYKIQRSSKDTSSMVLLTITRVGLTLRNLVGKEIVTYPLQSLAFSGVCSEDKRYFGIVTRKILTDQSPAMSSSYKVSPNLSKARHVVLCSCHVFMIGINLVEHDSHIETAKLFGVPCKPSLKFTGCICFPLSASDILQELNNFYINRHGRSRNASISSITSSSASNTPSSAEMSTPDKMIISNTLERIRGNSLIQTSKDARKLMISPPSSLVGLNDKEKKEILHEIEAQKKTEESDASDYMQESIRGRTDRRKSAPDTSEVCSTSSLRRNSSRPLVNSYSLKIGHRKPPLGPVKMNITHPKNMTSDTSSLKSGNGLFNGLKRTIRRKSDGAVLSPNQTIRDMLKGNKNKRQDTPPSYSKYGMKKDTNEDVKRLSITSVSSELSLDEPVCRVEGWAQSFERLLSDAVGVRCLQEFLKKEFSEENVLFWVACERFKRTKDIDKMKLLANDIFRNYLSPKGPFLVNVDQAAVKKAQENLDTPNSEMFTKPQEQVFQLMKFDSYNRFLKSQLYQECLLAENADRLFPFEDEIEEELRKKPAWVKKSKSSVHDANERKNNLLNFLSKGVKKTLDNRDHNESTGTMGELNRDISLSSPESNGHGPRDPQLWDGLNSKSTCAFVRVIFPDGSSAMVVAERGQTIRESLQGICEQKKIVLQAYDVTVGSAKQAAHLDRDISTLPDHVIFLERRVLFRFDLPNGRSVGIKANPGKTLGDVLQPVMKKNGFNIHDYAVHVMNYKVSITLDVNISSVENKRLVVTKLKKNEKQNSEKSTGQDLRASFRRFRSSSFKDEKNGKSQGTLEHEKIEKEKLSHKRSDELKTDESFSRKFGHEMKHLILGRTRSADDDGANALMTVLQKSQSGRLDDQRGMIPRDLEMPEFLKVSSNTPSPVRHKCTTTNGNVHSSSSLERYAGSPFIVDRGIGSFHSSPETLHKTDMSLLFLDSGNPSLCSVQSWKEIQTPDRELIDTSFVSRDSINSILSQESKNSKETLLAHLENDQDKTKKTVCKENSAAPFSPGYCNDIIDIDLLSSCDYNSTPVNSKFPTSNERDRSRSFDTCNVNKKHVIGFNTNRPKPINAINEKEISYNLEDDGYDVITMLEPETTLQSETTLVSSPNNSITQPNHETPCKDLDTLFPNYTPPTPIYNNGVTKSWSSNETAFSERKIHNGTPLSLDMRKTKSAERLGSVDLINYDLSPRSSEASRNLRTAFTNVDETVGSDNIQLIKPDTLTSKNIGASKQPAISHNGTLQNTNEQNKLVIFKANAIPTPEKSKLLKGETILGRQNEKITFV